MLKATAGSVLPTTIIGSLPRPSWYTKTIGTKSFLDAMVDSTFREQYVDALSVYLREQELAGLDIVTDGDCRFDNEVGGQSWTRYPTQHMDGFEHDRPRLAQAGAGGLGFPRGHILHDYLEARVMPKIVGPGRARRSAVHGDVEDSAASDTAPGQVWNSHSRARRVRGRGLLLQGSSVTDHGDQRRLQRGAARPRRRRLSGDPDGGAADPPARRARIRRRSDQPGVHARGVQQHGQGPA